jgi:hypothetical protein
MNVHRTVPTDRRRTVYSGLGSSDGMQCVALCGESNRERRLLDLSKGNVPVR